MMTVLNPAEVSAWDRRKAGESLTLQESIPSRRRRLLPLPEEVWLSQAGGKCLLSCAFLTELDHSCVLVNWAV